MSEKCELKDILRLLCREYTDDMPIILFGAGERGRRLALYFKNVGKPIYCFLDNNVEKQYKEIEGIMCYPREFCNPWRETALFIVTPEHSEELYCECAKEYSHVLPSKVVELIGYMPSVAGYSDFVPIGHYYSTYPDLKTVMQKSKDRKIEDSSIFSIDLNEVKQKEVLMNLTQYYSRLPNWVDIEEQKQSKYRYRYGNPSLSQGDAIGLYSMLCLLAPKRLIEVGSGYTSAIELDVNEFQFNNEMELAFIEPYPDNLHAILKKEDHVRVLQKGVEDIPFIEFKRLEKGDVLFVDSTHVSKRESDVNYLFFEILPQLNPGVYIHLHDIFYPFEYPMDWTVRGMAWNELYLLRAFLQNNHDYEIIFFQNMMEQKYPEVFLEKWPLQDKEIHGGSFWMRKIR
ncbi:MAG: class I SAM-dependent methyltransferase [Lachnospiraceae bacterium]